MISLKALLKMMYIFISRKSPPLSVFAAFLFRVMWSEYHMYAKIKHKFGADCFVLGGVFCGTGDYYCVGLYLGQWLERHGIRNYVYIIKPGAEENAMQLFPVFRGHIYPLPDRLMKPSYIMTALCGEDNVDMHCFHAPTLPNSICGGVKNVMQGYRGLNMLDYYLHIGFCLARDTESRLPEFSQVEGGVQYIFAQYGALPDKTVLLAPHTTGNSAYSLPSAFWEQVVERLKQLGYHTLTNCVGNEIPIQGTAAIHIPYAQIVPFLEMAGGFIGIRSGLCEVISSAVCKKVILHTYRSEWWYDGCSISFTGLVHMGLCEDAVEFTYCDGNDISSALAVFEKE